MHVLSQTVRNPGILEASLGQHIHREALCSRIPAVHARIASLCPHLSLDAHTLPSYPCSAAVLTHLSGRAALYHDFADHGSYATAYSSFPSIAHAATICHGLHCINRGPSPSFRPLQIFRHYCMLHGRMIPCLRHISLLDSIYS